MRLHTLPPVLALLAVSCGSRSGLGLDTSAGDGGTGGLGAAPSGGTGASSGGSGGAGATGGGGGNGGVTCAAFDLTGSPLSFTASASASSPRFAYANESSTLVAFVSTELPFPPTPGPAVHLQMSSFAPWGGWPSTLGPGEVASFVVGVNQFALDFGAADGTLAVAYPASPGPPQGLFFNAGVSLGGGVTAPVLSLALPGLQSHLARFVRANKKTHLVGFESSSGGHHAFHLTRVSDGIVDASQTWVGCATTALDGDAVAMGAKSYLVAFSSSRPFGTCLDDDGTDTPAHLILGGHLSGGGVFDALPFEIDAPDVVRFVRLLPRFGGAWLIYQYEGVNAETPPPVMLVPLDELGKLVGPAVPILDGGLASVPPAFASLDDRLAMAWLDDGSTIRIRILDALANSVAERAFQPDAVLVEPELELLGSPSGTELLLGWSHKADASQPLEAFVAKFCVPGG